MVKIFLASDNEAQNENFKTIFSKLYTIECSSNEQIITGLIQANHYDIVLINPLINNAKEILKLIKSTDENVIIIFLLDGDSVDKELIKFANAFITKDMNNDLIQNTININLRTKNSLNMLATSNRDLADSLYRLNALYSTSSQFAGTLNKEKLIKYMVEGLDKALSFSLTSTLTINNENEPVLILNSLYELSEELISALKLRTILNYNSLYENKDAPLSLEIDKLKVIKTVKYPANRFTFTLFQYDNMFAPISLGENFFGCIEIFKENTFSEDDATYFQTIVQQVSLPLKSATLYQELIETNTKLEKLERLKSEFISIVSHELRTPLTSIKNSLDILMSGRCGEITEASEKFLTMAMRNVQRLSGIINDLLDISKIEAGKMEFKFAQISIENVIDYVKTTLATVASSKQISIITDIENNLPTINADSQRLEQVLTNLVSNALKFTPENKNITITASLINAKNIKINEYFKNEIPKLNGNYIQICVADEGIGMEPADMVRAFDKFAQIENSLSRKVGGTGLGLPIAKQLLEAHNGAIWCDSELNKGAKFYFVLPSTN